MSSFSWDRELLCLSNESGEQVHKWTYSAFEKFLNESITPSMYNYMASYVMSNMSEEMMDDFCEYDHELLDSEAVDSYFDQPILDKIEMHQQELENLEKHRQNLVIRKYAAEQSDIFDSVSPEWNDIIHKFSREIDFIETQIHEEQQWRGGHERGAED